MCVPICLKGAAKGPLHGKRVTVKDSIFVADVPMMYGTSVLEGFKPDFDATVVTRLLEFAPGQASGNRFIMLGQVRSLG